MVSPVKKLKRTGLNVMLKYCRGDLTDGHKLSAVFKFQVTIKVHFRRGEEVKEYLSRYYFIRKVSQIELMCIKCWVHGTQMHEQT